MADFDNVRFPVKISLGAVGGPRFKTSLAVMASGAESRVQEWETERGEWTVSHSVKRPIPAAELFAFVRVIGKGRANTFRFKDWTDFVCLNGEGLFIDSDDSPPVKQMVKRYTFYGIDGTAYHYDRIISKPIEGKVTTDASGLDYATGQAISGTFWYGEFDCWVRQDSDWTKAQVITPKQGEAPISRRFLISFPDIELVEVIFEETEEAS